MRFTWGPPPSTLSADDLASGEWTRVRHPSMWVYQLAAIPVGLLMAALLFVVWAALTPSFDVASGDTAHVLAVVAGILVLGPLLQIATHPPMGGYRQSLLGFWPSRLLLYTACDAPLTRTRYLQGRSLPFLLLALGPLSFVLTAGVPSGWAVFVSCFAAAVFGFDALLALAASFELPADAQLGNVRFQVYWRTPVR
jgi:hypothetical protein